MKIKIIIGKEEIPLTKDEFRELCGNNSKMVQWGVLGTYGNGDDIVETKAYSVAKKLVKKLCLYY